MKKRIGHGERGGETGSAVTESAMTMALIVAVFLVVCQFAYAVHVRSTLTMAAIEGARRGAQVGSSSDQAVARAQEFMSGTFAGGKANFHASRDHRDGVNVMRVDGDAPLPVLGPFGIGFTLHATGRAVMEDRTP